MRDAKRSAPSAMEYLTNSGVAVEHIEPGRLHANGYRLDYEGVSCLIYPKGTLWVFEYWECIPGPGEDDFLCYHPSSSEALSVVLDFYFGDMTMISSWLIPLHRHPELSPADATRAIAEAINVSQETFEGIAERRRQRIYGNRLLGKTPWEWALQYQFLRVMHENDKTITLRLRRDAQEAYIVHTL